MTAPLSPNDLTRRLHEATTVVRPVPPSLVEIRRRAAARRRRRRVVTLGTLAPLAAAASVAAIVLIGPGADTDAGRIHVRELPGHTVTTPPARGTAHATPGPSAPANTPSAGAPSAGATGAPSATPPVGGPALGDGGVVAAEHYLAPDQRGGLSIYGFHGGPTERVVTPAADWTDISSFVTDAAGWVYYTVDTATTSEIHAVRMSDEHVVKLVKLQTGGDPNNNVRNIAVSRDGRLIAYTHPATASSSFLTVMNIQSRQRVATFTAPTDSVQDLIGFSTDDRILYYDEPSALFQQPLPAAGSRTATPSPRSVFYRPIGDANGGGLGAGTVDVGGNIIVAESYPDKGGAAAPFHDLTAITPAEASSLLSSLTGFEVFTPEQLQWVGNGDGTLVVQLSAPCGPGATVALINGTTTRVDVPPAKTSCG